MKCIVKFDCYADIIEVPEFVAARIREYRNLFLDWLYDKSNDHKYWVGEKDGVCYDTDAFVEWLNEKVIAENCPPAAIIGEGFDVDTQPEGMIEIFF